MRNSWIITSLLWNKKKTNWRLDIINKTAPIANTALTDGASSVEGPRIHPKFNEKNNATNVEPQTNFPRFINVTKARDIKIYDFCCCNPKSNCLIFKKKVENVSKR